MSPCFCLFFFSNVRFVPSSLIVLVKMTYRVMRVLIDSILQMIAIFLFLLRFWERVLRSRGGIKEDINNPNYLHTCWHIVPLQTSERRISKLSQLHNKCHVPNMVSTMHHVQNAKYCQQKSKLNNPLTYVLFHNHWRKVLSVLLVHKRTMDTGSNEAADKV